MGRGKFLGENGHPIVKYGDTLRSSVQRRGTDKDAVWVVGSDGP